MAYWKDLTDAEIRVLVRDGIDTVAACMPTCDDCAQSHVPFRTLPGGSGPPLRQQARPWCWSPVWGGKCTHCGRDC